MVRKASLIALVLLLLLAVLSPAHAQTESGPTVLDSSADVQFPARIRFNLSVESSADIVDIRLRYRVERESFAEVTSEGYAEFSPGKKVSARWSLEMVRTGGLPPGTGLRYWWLVTDADGSKIETTPARIQFDDTRYRWRSITEDRLTLYWYEGDEAFARELLAAAGQTLATLSLDTGATLGDGLRLYIHASAEELRGAMIFAEQWVGGGAFLGFSTLALGISPADLEWGRGAIAHEVAHLVTYSVTRNPYTGLPTWLDEGLAMHAEGPMRSNNVQLLKDALDSNALITIRSLSSPFSALPGLAYLSYAQSQSVVEYLIDTYGQAKMLELLGTFRQGSTYDGALRSVYGFDTEGLNARWLESLSRQFQKTGSGAKATSAAGALR